MNFITVLLLSALSLHYTVLYSQSGDVAEIKPYKGRLLIHVNDKPYLPVFYAPTHAYGGRWSWEEVPQRNIKNFCDLGVRLYQLDLYFEDIWYKNNPALDIKKAQKQVAGVLEVCPDAHIVLRVHVNAPYWWNDANPDECTQYASGPVDIRPYGPPFNNEDGDTERPKRASLASLKWRNEAGEKLVEFCKKMSQTQEGKSVMGIHVSCGVYGEWHYWGFPSASADTGPAMTSYFRNWLKGKYKTDAAMQQAWKMSNYTFANATVPDTTERLLSSYGTGIFRSPEKQMRVIDYFTCQQEVVADDIDYFCKIVKDHWGRKTIVGVFYGYFHMTFARQASGGHLFIERIQKSPYIDYLSAPQSYYDGSKLAGGPAHSRGIIESSLLNGKLWLDELDNGYLQETNTPDVVRSLYNTDKKYESMLSRCAIHPLSRGIGFWYYDFGLRKSFGWWDNPDYLASIKKTFDLFNTLKEKPYTSEADVLIVWDQESFYYFIDKWTPLSYNLLDLSTTEMYKTGASTDHIYAFDLPKCNLKKYKAIVFMNTYKIDDNLKNYIKTNVCKDGRTIVWQYLPGVTQGKTMGLANTQSLLKTTIAEGYSTKKPKIKVTGVYDTVSYEVEKAYSPFVYIKDPKAKPVATIANTDTVMIAMQKMADYTEIYSAVAVHTPTLFRSIFKGAGAHIYNTNENDVTYAGSGLVWIHSVLGGQREITLKSGKKINIELPKLSTIVLDAASGERLF